MSSLQRQRSESSGCTRARRPAGSGARPMRMKNKPQTVTMTSYDEAAANARVRVRCAVKSGKLPNLKTKFIICADCKRDRAVQYDHRDLSKPLDVVPVCATCNVRRGKAAFEPSAACSHEAGEADSSVLDSRPRGFIIRRRRKCLKCGQRFTTWEITRTTTNRQVYLQRPTLRLDKP